MSAATPCPGDAQLAAFADGVGGSGERPALVSHIEECPSCRRAVAALVAARSGLSMTAQSPGDAPAAAAALQSGAVLGRYVVMQQLGAGGMGSVWAAWDPELHRKVALKLLHHTDAAAQARLQREARAMARLSHPNVVSVHDLGEYRGQLYLALELVDGQTLAAWQKGRRWREVLAAYLDALAGLAAVQAAGILHRDFKPQNVLVDAAGRARVTDFGLARLEVRDEPDEPVSPGVQLEATGQGVSTLTHAGQVLGTPAYMAPEQLAAGVVDARSDQFGFCASLYEGLFGQRPFPARDVTELRALHQAGAPAPRSANGAPAWLRRAVLRGLASDPAARFPDLAALRAALTPPRRRGLLAAAAAVIAVAGLGSWWAWRSTLCTGAEQQLDGAWDAAAHAALAARFEALGKPWAKDAASRTAAVFDRYAAGWAAMHREACEATRIRGDQSDLHLGLRMECLQQRRTELGALARTLSQADAPAAEKAVSAAVALPPLSRCADLAALSAPTRRPDTEVARKEADALDESLAQLSAQLATGQYAAGRASAKATAERAAALAFAPLQARAEFARGSFEERLGDYAVAEEAYTRSSLAADLGNVAWVLADSRIRLAWTLGFYQRKNEAADLQLRQAEVAVKKAGENHELVGALEEAQGAVAMARGQFADAQAHYEKAVAEYTAAFGADDARTMRARSNLAGAWLARGEHGKAAAEYRAAIEATERAFGPRHPNIGRVSVNLANALIESGDLDAALAAADRGLELSKESLGASHADVGAAFINRGAVLRRMGRLDEALDAYRSGQGVFEASLGPEHPRTAVSLNNVGSVLLMKGEAGEAEKLFRRSLAIQTKVSKPDHPDVAWAWLNIGNALATGHKYDEALEAHRKALEIREKAFGPSHTHVAGALNSVGEDLALSGRCKEALPLYERALAIREKLHGPNHESLAYSLLGLGRCRIDLKAPQTALEPLERALALRAPSKSAAEHAEPKWLLGRALWDSGRDRARARVLVREAIADYGDERKEDRQVAQAWLASH